MKNIVRLGVALVMGVMLALSLMASSAFAQNVNAHQSSVARTAAAQTTIQTNHQITQPAYYHRTDWGGWGWGWGWRPWGGWGWGGWSGWGGWGGWGCGC